MLIYFAFSLIALMGFCGLALDAGRMEVRSLQLQTAADSAALSYSVDSLASSATAEAAVYASNNNIPTPAITVATSGTTTTVTASTTLSPIFGGLLTGGSTASLSRSAILKPSNGPCDYIATTTTVANSGRLTLACPMFSGVGYSVGYASQLNGSPALTAGSSGSSTIQGSVPYGVTYNAASVTDPLAYVAAPVFVSCDPTHLTKTNYSYATKTILPGTYCGGINIATMSTITMSPGTYIITGGISLSGNSTLSGSGVTIYLTQGGGSSYGALSVDSASIIQLSAPTSNPYAGILIFADRAWTGAQSVSLTNSSTYNSDGLIYAANSGVTFTNASIATAHGHYFDIVAHDLTTSAAATATFSNDYSLVAGGNPMHLPGGGGSKVLQ